MTAVSPQAFRDLKGLVRIHLKQILKLDKITDKVPMNAVALLVVIGSEALSKFLHPRKGPEYLFAREHKERHRAGPGERMSTEAEEIQRIISASVRDVLCSIAITS